MTVAMGLGTIGFKFKSKYFDLFLRPYFGMYVNDGTFRKWYKLPTFRLVKRDVIGDPETARRKLREEGIKPYRRCYLGNKPELMEVISYPYVDDNGRVAVLIRVPDDPTTLRNVNACKIRLSVTG